MRGLFCFDLFCMMNIWSKESLMLETTMLPSRLVDKIESKQIRGFVFQYSIAKDERLPFVYQTSTTFVAEGWVQAVQGKTRIQVQMRSTTYAVFYYLVYFSIMLFMLVHTLTTSRIAGLMFSFAVILFAVIGWLSIRRNIRRQKRKVKSVLEEVLVDTSTVTGDSLGAY